MKSTLLKLIEDDIKNTHLINGLKTIGINADYYILNTSDVVFSLINERMSEEAHRGYFNLMKSTLSTNGLEQIHVSANKLYDYLMKQNSVNKA